MEDRLIGCKFCSFKSPCLHDVDKHLLENHLDKIDTDYDTKSKVWTYLKIKQEYL